MVYRRLSQCRGVAEAEVRLEIGETGQSCRSGVQSAATACCRRTLSTFLSTTPRTSILGGAITESWSRKYLIPTAPSSAEEQKGGIGYIKIVRR